MTGAPDCKAPGGGALSVNEKWEGNMFGAGEMLCWV